MGQTIALIALIIVVVVSILLMWALTKRQHASGADLNMLRNDMQSALMAQSQSLNSQLAQVTQTVLQQLGQVRSALQEGLTSSGNLVSQAQTAIASEIRSSQDVLTRVGQQLGQIQQAGRDLSQATQTLQSVLGGAKTRGSLGEVALETILADALPASAYKTQYRFDTGAIVDAIVRSGDKLIAIDSKFPLESYQRLLESGDEARREFFQAVRKHAESISEKYILQNEGTLDCALMFVPSEGIYYEFLMTSDAKLGRLDDLCRNRKIFAVSPNTLHAYLMMILVGLRGMQVEENARRLYASLGGLQVQLDSFAKMYETLGNHLRHAQQCHDEAGGKLDRLQNNVGQMAHGAPPESAVRALETAQLELKS